MCVNRLYKSSLSLITFVAAMVLSGCGDKDISPETHELNHSSYSAADGSVENVATPSPQPTATALALEWQAGTFIDASYFANRCELPRTGTNTNSSPYPDLPGSAFYEKMWLRSWSNDTYLWYDEIIDTAPADYDTVEYFDLLKTQELTPAGNAKDHFHFSMDTSAFEQESQGSSVGFGLDLVRIAADNYLIGVTYVEPLASASEDIARGSIIWKIGDIDLETTNNDEFKQAIDLLFPEEAGQTVNLDITRAGSNDRETITLTAETVISSPVGLTKAFTDGNSKVGYLLFNSHVSSAELALYNAVSDLQEQHIDELVLDLRYNGGGLLQIASQLAYMIAGEDATVGKTFEKLGFNDKYPDLYPYDNSPIEPLPFYSTLEYGFQTIPLPSLDLSRLVVLTSEATCSASESIINSLRGIDIEVVLIGSKTCGKPYGFVPEDNCGTTYFTVQFEGENDKGFGDYPDGFSAITSSEISSVKLPGCYAYDDVIHELGDPLENQLNTALYYLQNNKCPGAQLELQKSTQAAAVSNTALHSPFNHITPHNNTNLWNNNRIVDWPKTQTGSF